MGPLSVPQKQPPLFWLRVFLHVILFGRTSKLPLEVFSHVFIWLHPPNPTAHKASLIPQISQVSLFTHTHITIYFTSAAHSIGIISHMAFCVIFLQRLEASVSTCPIHLYILDTNTVLEVRTSHWILVKWVKRESVLNFTTSSCLHKWEQWLRQTIFHQSRW